MNAIAKDIRVNRQKFDSIVVDYRAYWGKVYRNEVTKYLSDIIEQQKSDSSDALKKERYAIEQVCARIKGITLSDEVKAIVKQMHDEDKLTFSCLRSEYIVNGLKGLDFVGEVDGEDVLFEKKKIKGTDEYEWKPVEKWTEAKVGRYFRLATLRINESK